MYITNFRKLQCVCMYVQTGRINVLNILYIYIHTCGIFGVFCMLCYLHWRFSSMPSPPSHPLAPPSLPHCLSIICILTLSTAQIIQQRSIETILLFGSQPYWQNCRFWGAFHRRVWKLYCTAPSDRSSWRYAASHIFHIGCVIRLGELQKQIFGKSWEFGPTGLTPPPPQTLGFFPWIYRKFSAKKGSNMP